MVQPHADKDNDRPIRLYGVIPLKVTRPADEARAGGDHAPPEWAPQSKATVTVAETSGRAMNYTLAIVDEGLLGLTNFKTPNLHDEFYKREALGVVDLGPVRRSRGRLRRPARSIAGARRQRRGHAGESGRRQVALPAGGAVPRAVRAQGRREARAHRSSCRSTWARCASWSWPVTAAPMARRRNPCSCASR